MSVLCLGPCCIPVAALAPLLLLLLSPILNCLRKTPLAKYLPDPNAKKKEVCDDSTCCDSGNVTSVKSIDEWEELKRSEPLLIADFMAGWCKPCKKMAPVFEGLAEEHKGAARFVKVDIDDLPEAFDGMPIPAFHVLQGGTKVDSLGGAQEEKLRQMIAKHCKKIN